MIDKVMAHARLTDADILALAPSANLTKVRAAMEAMGYGLPFPYA